VDEVEAAVLTQLAVVTPAMLETAT